MKTPKVGDAVADWPQGTISAVEPYRGKYPQWFKWVITIQCKSGAVVQCAVEG